MSDKMFDMPITPLPPVKVQTSRAGPFTFQLGVDPIALQTPTIRVDDAWQTFRASPLAEVANQLQREVLVQSVFGTNTIEGATLTLDQTQSALDLDPDKVQGEQQLRVRNIKAAYDHAVAAAENPGWQLSVDYVRAIHARICADLPHPDNRPGLFRDNPRERPTVVGDADHGGQYKPPQFRGDIDRLMDALMDWHRQLVDAGISPLVRAPLVHLYYELIHPFWDGNGRVGRVLEATILRHAGYKYAPFAMAKYYQEQLHPYFALFNACRKAAATDQPHPNQPFVLFHLEGLRVVIARLQGRVNELVDELLLKNQALGAWNEKLINPRQYAILRKLVDHPGPLTLEALRVDPIYQGLYFRKAEKTRQRDMRHLRDTGLIVVDPNGVLRLGRRHAETASARKPK